VVEVKPPFKTTPMGLLENGTAVGALRIGSPKVQVAANDNYVIAAIAGQICVADWDIHVKVALNGDFQPKSMSLDEAGRMYLVLESQGRTALWLITPEGERRYAFQYPQGMIGGATPPIVGYDHAAYLLAGQYIMAVAPDGKLDWSKVAPGAIKGAIVTAGDQLLISEGSSVAAWSRMGERTVVFSAPEALASAPVLTAAGDLLVASQSHLYCLTPDATRRPAANNAPKK